MAKNKDRDPSEMILGTFRVRAGMWEQFKQLASDNNATATDLIISFIENCLQAQSIPQSNLDVIPQSNLDDIYTYIDSKLDKTLSIQQVEDLIDSRIGGSIQAGDIKDAIATSYAAAMGQFNGLLEELQLLKKQFEELETIPPAAVPIPLTSEQLTTDNEQLTEDVESDRTPGDDLTEIKSDNSSVPIMPEKNQIDYIQKILKKSNIKKSAGQIREAFIKLKFDGSNYDQLRDKIIEIFIPQN